VKLWLKRSFGYRVQMRKKHSFHPKNLGKVGLNEQVVSERRQTRCNGVG
jgi:hypothetical protein